MIGIGRPAGIAESNLQTYEERLGNALASLAKWVDADHRERFFHWYRHWGQLVRMEGAVDRTGDAHRCVAAALPCFCELVVTLREASCQVGWLSGGRNGAHLAETVSGLLHSTLSAHLENGGDTERAQTLAALFAAAFPNLDRLRDMSALAQVFLVAVVPRGSMDLLKLYLNPRVSSGDSVRHLTTMAVAAGADRNEFGALVDGLYADRGHSARLYGLGIDLAPHEEPRLKLYVRADRAAARAALRRLGVDGAPLQFLSEFSGPALANQVELALAMRQAQRSVKATQFWSGRNIGKADESALLEWIERQGFERTPLDRMVASLRAPSSPSLQRSPLHAVGIESSQSVGSKLNVYLQPEL